VRPAVHHRVPDLDTGGPAVEQDPSSLELEDRQQCKRFVVVGFVGVHGGRQLTLDMGRDVADLFGVRATHDQAGRAEHFGLQRLRGQEGLGVGAEQCGAADAWRVVGHPACDQIGLVLQRLDATPIGVGDVWRQHRGRLGPGEGVARRADERIQIGPVDRDHQAGVGAELSGAHGQ
jgi:hypothetical protein